MIRQLWQVFRGTLYDLVHGKGHIPLAIFLVGTPLLFTVLFGLVYEKNVINHVPLVIYDQDQSSMSRQLIQAYEDSEKFNFVAQVTTEEDMQEYLSDGKALAALEIPSDFSKEVRSGRGKDLMLMVNYANSVFGSAALTGSQEVARSFSVAAGQKLVEAINLQPAEAMNAVYPVRMGIRILGNPTNNYTSFMLSGLMLNGLQVGVMISLAPAFVLELKRKKYQQYPAGVFVLGSIAAYLCFSLIGYFLSLGIIIGYFAMPMRGSWLDVFVLGLAYLIFVAGVISLLASLSPSRELAMQIPLAYIMPSTLYGGLSWPFFSMNKVATVYSKMMPMTYTGDTLRDIMLLGSSSQLTSHLAIMLTAGIATGTLATLIFAWRRRRQQKAETRAEKEAAEV